MDGATATARRMYHHVHHGGQLTENDIAGLVRALENKDAHIARLATEVERLRRTLRGYKEDLCEGYCNEDEWGDAGHCHPDIQRDCGGCRAACALQRKEGNE